MKSLFIVLPLIVMIGALIWAFFLFGGKLTRKGYKQPANSEPAKPRKGQKALAICLLVIGFLVLVFVPGSIHQINAGEVAVVRVWGDAKQIRTAGIHFDFWLSHKYDIYDAKVQQTIVKTETYSNDGQTMDIEIVIQYQIQQNNALIIAKNYGGLEMLESRIETVAIEKMKSVLSQKAAMKIIETRAEVSSDVETAIRKAITSDYCVDITTVVLTDISFTDAFEKTVEDKMIAEQEKLKAEYEKEKAIIVAEQALEVAKKEAEAKLEQAKGEANAIEALAAAEANAIKVKSIEAARMLGFDIVPDTSNPDVTEYKIDFTGKTDAEVKLISEYLKYIEYLEKWDGKLPTVMTGDSASILIPTNPTDPETPSA